MYSDKFMVSDNMLVCKLSLVRKIGIFVLFTSSISGSFSSSFSSINGVILVE